MSVKQKMLLITCLLGALSVGVFANTNSDDSQYAKGVNPSVCSIGNGWGLAVHCNPGDSFYCMFFDKGNKYGKSTSIDCRISGYSFGPKPSTSICYFGNHIDNNGNIVGYGVLAYKVIGKIKRNNIVYVACKVFRITFNKYSGVPEISVSNYPIRFDHLSARGDSFDGLSVFSDANNDESSKIKKFGIIFSDGKIKFYNGIAINTDTGYLIQPLLESAKSLYDGTYSSACALKDGSGDILIAYNDGSKISVKIVDSQGNSVGAGLDGYTAGEQPSIISTSEPNVYMVYYQYKHQLQYNYIYVDDTTGDKILKSESSFTDPKGSTGINSSICSLGYGNYLEVHQSSNQDVLYSNTFSKIPFLKIYIKNQMPYTLVCSNTMIVMATQRPFTIVPYDVNSYAVNKDGEITAKFFNMTFDYYLGGFSIFAIPEIDLTEKITKDPKTGKATWSWDCEIPYPTKSLSPYNVSATVTAKMSNTYAPGDIGDIYLTLVYKTGPKPKSLGKL